jgi:SAM-dependent methyltransferase
MPDEVQEYWHTFYDDVLSRGDPWIDYSNDRERAGPMQALTHGIALAAAGSLWQQSCLDVGCGPGVLTRAMAALGAREVVAIDFVESALAEHRTKYPEIRWLSGNVADPEFVAGLGRFDVIFFLEVLQYLPYRAVLAQLWEKVNDGGRIVGVIPNRANQYVREVIERFEGRYAPPTSAEIQEILAELPGVGPWGLQGLFWRKDQSILPYDVSPLAGPAHFKSEPKRLLFVARKGPQPTATNGQS